MACGGIHRVYMAFFERRGWYCQFLESDLKTPLPRTIYFKTSEKVLQLADHSGAFRNLESHQMFEHAISTGRGGVWLELTEEQYRRLKSTD